jgi:Protein of unknown function (DUF2034)
MAHFGTRTSEKLGILVSPREATKGVRDSLARSVCPLMWISMQRDGTVRQALWNRKAESVGLGALGVEARYREGCSKLDPEIALTWHDEELPTMDCVERELAQREALWLARWDCENLSEMGKAELLEMLETSFPDLAQGRIVESTDRSSFDAIKAQVLARLKEKSIDSVASMYLP